MKPIIFDCDDVLLAWQQAFAVYLSNYHSINVDGLPKDWDMSHWTGQSRERTFELIQEFNASFEFAFIPPVDDAECIGRLVGNRPIFVLSCCGSAHHALRTYNLRTVFGPIFDEIICLDLGASKVDALKSFYDQFGPCIWVEDNHGHAIAGKEIGHEAYLLRRSYNETLEMPGDGLFWADSLSDAVSRFN